MEHDGHGIRGGPPRSALVDGAPRAAHERLRGTKWELPGGHIVPGETLPQAAARETREEAGVSVVVGRLLATCVHEWQERRRRNLVSFFDASPSSSEEPRVPPGEPHLVDAAWMDPLVIDPEAVSAFLHPLIEQQKREWVAAPFHFRMTHRMNEEGLWEPAPIHVD